MNTKLILNACEMAINSTRDFQDLHHFVVLSNLTVIKNFHDVYPVIRSICGGGGFTGYIKNNKLRHYNQGQLKNLYNRITDYVNFLKFEIIPLSKPLKYLFKNQIIKYSIYRGMHLSYIPVTNQKYTQALPSSWTTDINIAREFANRTDDDEVACIFKLEISLLDPVLILSSLSTETVMSFFHKYISDITNISKDEVKRSCLALNNSQSEIHLPSFEYNILDCREIYDIDNKKCEYNININANLMDFERVSNNTKLDIANMYFQNIE
jgi:hypothetical protein